MGRSGVACALALLVLSACGGRAPLPQACLEAQPGDVLRALRDAPGAVALDDGTPLSRCVARAVDDAQLQTLGATLTTAAARLARRMAGEGDAGEAAALQLGFLIGASARGAAQTAGLQGELANRVAGAGGDGRGPHRDALLRGRAAGRRHG